MNRSFHWDSMDYKSSLKETERNLSSMQHQLESKIRKPIYKGLASSDKAARNHQNGSALLSDNVSYHYQNGSAHSHMIGSHSSPQMNNLLRRIEEQSRTIAHLNETVKIQAEDIFSLNKQMSDLKNRLATNTPSLINDRKFEMFQREVRNELENLMIHIRRPNSSSSIMNPPAHIGNFRTNYQNDLSRDLQMQKRMIEEETDAVRREIDSLKTRIVKIENDSNLYARDVQDCNRRCVMVERDISSLTDEQRRTKKNTERKETDLIYLKKELQDISNILGDLQSRSTIEQRNNARSPRKKSTKTVSSRSKTKHGKRTLGVMPDVSQNDVITSDPMFSNISFNSSKEFSDSLLSDNPDFNFQDKEIDEMESILKIEELDVNDFTEDDGGSLFGTDPNLGDALSNNNREDIETAQSELDTSLQSKLSQIFHDDGDDDGDFGLNVEDAWTEDLKFDDDELSDGLISSKNHRKSTKKSTKNKSSPDVSVSEFVDSKLTSSISLDLKMTEPTSDMSDFEGFSDVDYGEDFSAFVNGDDEDDNDDIF